MKLIWYKDLVQTFKPIERNPRENHLFGEYEFFHFQLWHEPLKGGKNINKIQPLQLSTKTLYSCNQTGLGMSHAKFH